jgi:hypothetical protein
MWQLTLIFDQGAFLELPCKEIEQVKKVIDNYLQHPEIVSINITKQP